MEQPAACQKTPDGRKKLRKAGVVLATGALLLAATGIARADVIYNNLDATVDSVAEVMPLNAGGDTGSTVLAVAPANGDGKQGCNLTGSTSLTLSLSSSDTAVATVSPASVTFTACSDTKTVTVTPVDEGTATVSAALVSNSTGGSFNLAPATFQVNVAPPANTAPTLNITGVTAGASYAKGAVPAAVCEVTDAEDGPSTFPATLGAVTGADAATGVGSQTASCDYTDAGDLHASASLSYNIVDATAPEISYTLTPAVPDGSNGWYRSAVSLDWTVAEPDSPSTLALTGCTDELITLDQLPANYSCAASSDGGNAGPVTVSIKKDGTAPTVSYSGASGTVGSNGWYTSDVTATFTATDATSGPALASGTATSSGEGSAVVVQSPAFSDDAGNVAPAGAASHSFKVDKTDPTTAFDSVVGDAYFGSVAAEPTCTASDDVSGPASCVVSGYSTAVGTHTMTATATDNAGRSSTAQQTYTVLAWTLKGFYQPVDMNGVLNTVKGGSTVPAKFEVFAGATELTDPALVALSATKITCSLSALDDIELTASGSTSLRYDAVSGQFIYNWKTPATPGSCYKLTMKAADGSSIAANFKMK